MIVMQQLKAIHWNSLNNNVIIKCTFGQKALQQVCLYTNCILLVWFWKQGGKKKHNVGPPDRCWHLVEIHLSVIWIQILIFTYSALQKYQTFQTFASFQATNMKMVNYNYLQRMNSERHTIMKRNNIYWKFQTFLRNKNWRVGHAKTIGLFQCSKLS